jgi:hypothetical protein
MNIASEMSVIDHLLNQDWLPLANDSAIRTGLTV